jgi:urea-proton symporter
MISWQTALILTAAYIIAMLAVAWFSRLRVESASDFLVMNRELGTFRGAFSIAASWIWAPAVFICSQKAFEQGLPGILWFTLPNILCFFVFVPVALRARHLLPSGYSMPDFLYYRFNENILVHRSSLLVYFGYQLGAIVINALAGGTLLHALTGMPVSLAIGLMTTAAVAYSLISGLRASVMTDVVQMCLILFIALILVPWVISEAGGWSVVVDGRGGKSGQFGDIFDPGVAYSFGIATTIGLISGPIADQMFFQRAFAAKRDKIASIFVWGGVSFGIVPIVLSILGFVAAGLAIKNGFTVTDPQMVGPEVVAAYLPKWALAAFIVLAFAGLSSTLDSSFAAVSSLWAVDVFKRYQSPAASDRSMIRVARMAMLSFATVGTIIALLQPQLIWVFLIYGALASAMLVPVFFALFSTRVTAGGVVTAILLSVGVSVPMSIYANVTQNVNMVVLAALLPPVFGFISCCISTLRNRNPIDFDRLKDRLHTLER